MKVYVYQAALLCAPCGETVKRKLTEEGKAPANPDDESAFGSDDFPKGPYGNGGGEADSPQHCDHCGAFLENPLTTDGDEYVRRMIEPFSVGGASWEEVARRAENSGYHIKAMWARFYFAPGQ